MNTLLVFSAGMAVGIIGLVALIYFAFRNDPVPKRPERERPPRYTITPL